MDYFGEKGHIILFSNERDSYLFIVLECWHFEKKLIFFELLKKLCEKFSITDIRTFYWLFQNTNYSYYSRAFRACCEIYICKLSNCMYVE